MSQYPPKSVMQDHALRAFSYNLATSTVKEITRKVGHIDGNQIAALTIALTDHFRFILTSGEPMLGLRPLIHEAKTEDRPVVEVKPKG